MIIHTHTHTQKHKNHILHSLIPSFPLSNYYLRREPRQIRGLLILVWVTAPEWSSASSSAHTLSPAAARLSRRRGHGAVSKHSEDIDIKSWSTAHPLWSQFLQSLSDSMLYFDFISHKWLLTVSSMMLNTDITCRLWCKILADWLAQQKKGSFSFETFSILVPIWYHFQYQYQNDTLVWGI